MLRIVVREMKPGLPNTQRSLLEICVLPYPWINVSSSSFYSNLSPKGKVNRCSQLFPIFMIVSTNQDLGYRILRKGFAKPL